MGDPRRTRAWRTLAAQVVREEPTCQLRLAGCTYWSTQADHIKPVASHPHLGMVRTNIRGACEHCNKTRGTGKHDPPTQTPAALELFD